MSVQARPVDTTTEDFLLLGLPVVEFALELASGGFAPFFDLGIVDSAEFQKTLEAAQLRSAQSGTSKLVRELIRQFDATLQVGTFRHNGALMQLMFASNVLTNVGAGPIVVADDPFRLTADVQDFHDLANANITEPVTAMECDDITAEAVGTGDGTTGDTSGDFSLDFKPLVLGDVTSVTVAGVAFTPVAAFTAGNEVIIVVGTGATSGDMQFGVAGVAANVTGAILATYRPTHVFVENTDFVVDYKAGRIRVLDQDAATDPLKTNQPMRADYTYTRFAHDALAPFTQFIFAGKARIRQLTDVGMNVVWNVPKTQIRLTDDPFVFNRDEFTVTELALQLLEDLTDAAEPYGSLEIYQEGSF